LGPLGREGKLKWYSGVFSCDEWIDAGALSSVRLGYRNGNGKVWAASRNKYWDGNRWQL